MKIKVLLPEERAGSYEGTEARNIVKGVLHKIGQSIMVPEPMFSRVVRRRALDTLRSGKPIWDDPDEHGQPGGTVVIMQPKIVGIIHKDGSYEKVGEGPDQNPFGGRDGKDEADKPVS